MESPRRPSSIDLPDLHFSIREPFLDRERARRILHSEGLEALVVSEGRNVFHATQFYPLLERMSLRGTTLAVIPQDPARPVALVMPAFSYYYILADEGLLPGVQPFLFTPPGASADPASFPLTYRLAGEQVPAREQVRRSAIEAAAPYSLGLEQALTRALRELGITRGRVGYDEASLSTRLAAAAPALTPISAEDTPRRIRLVRSPAEIRMMTLASKANIEAAHATLAVARELGSLRSIRQRFFAEAALRGNTGVFMVVNGSSSEVYDEPLREGSAFLIDCVSQLRQFHGDYGRTVFVGDPTPRMRYCTEAMAKVWAEMQPKIRPGMRFSEVRTLGASLLKQFHLDAPVVFSPHSVGLAHTDQPRTTLDGRPLDVEIEANMILSIDCPLFETGMGGTAHLEDLVLVTPHGAVPIHDTGTPTYTI